MFHDAHVVLTKTHISCQHCAQACDPRGVAERVMIFRFECIQECFGGFNVRPFCHFRNIDQPLPEFQHLIVFNLHIGNVLRIFLCDGLVCTHAIPAARFRSVECFIGVKNHGVFLIDRVFRVRGNADTNRYSNRRCN